MSDDSAGLTDSLARVPQRIAGLLDLLTTLDTRIVTALDSLEEFGPRFDRMEAAILNIERATVNLDCAFEGALELLPDFMTKKLNQEGRRKVDPPMREVQE